jgi:hypothetical protein
VPPGPLAHAPRIDATLTGRAVDNRLAAIQYTRDRTLARGRLIGQDRRTANRPEDVG